MTPLLFISQSECSIGYWFLMSRKKRKRHMNKVMNFNTYGSFYGKFHKCSVSSVEQNIIVFDFGSSPYETWFVARMYPSDTICMDSDKPFLLALKAFFKSDVHTSVICNRQFLWTICLGNERIIYPVSKELKIENRFHFYATPYYVRDPKLVSQYLPGAIRPTYENIFFYKNTVLFLDNQDLPYPGGCYFDKCDPTDYYRICFLSNESIDHIAKIAAEWHSRRDVMNIPFMTRDVRAVPKFIQYKPLFYSGLSESHILSTGMIHKNLSSKKPELIIQDILNSYYKNLARRPACMDDRHLGLIMEWPFLLTYEGVRTMHDETPQKFVSLSINGNLPNHILYVCRPYERYIEYNFVPPTMWTPISFTYSTLQTDTNIRKVVIDTVVLGLVYKETFFCFSQPLLEGSPSKHPVLNTKYLLSIATTNLNEDGNLTVMETFRYNEKYSLNRVNHKGITLDTWCLTKAENTHPFPQKSRVQGLVKEWLDFFMEVGEEAFDVDVDTVRLALTLSKHNICYNLNISDEKYDLRITEDEVNFYMKEKVVQFINEARLVKQTSVKDSSICTIS